jgi:hypothetical protein
MTARPLHILALLLGLSLLVLGITACPSDDDDTAGDDDSAEDDDDVVDDDDAGDDDAGDDDAGDDDDDVIDYVDATIPDFAGCAGNQFTLMLGDGTEAGPYEGFFAEPASFANNSLQFTIRMGVTEAWTALNGNYSGMTAGTPIAFQSPSQDPGNVVLQAWVDASVVGGGPADLAGAYGDPSSNAHPDVGGEVVFDAVPAPNAESSGTYSGIIQKNVSLTDQQVLLGVRGCFTVDLVATD